MIKNGVFYNKKREHSDTVEALQQELDNLQNERRELKEKLRNTTKKAIFDNLVNNRRENFDFLSSSPSDPNRSNLVINNQLSSADTYPLIYEINLMRNVNRLLQRNIMEINKQYTRSLCDKFTSLPAISGKHSAVVRTEEVNLKSLSKQSNDLMVDLFKSLGDFKVENLRNKSTSNESKKNNISMLMVS